MKTNIRLILSLLVIFGILKFETVSASVQLAPLAAGDLDTTFGTGGIVSTDFGDADWASDIALQPDGKILAAGDTGLDFAIARYNPNGTLDTGFGANGKVTTDIYGYEDRGEAVTLLPDGKILMAGTAYRADSADFALVRYNADGSLDTSFGTSGKVTTNFDGLYNYGYAIALQSDGKIVVAGGDNDNFALARYNSNGTLDTGFGADGKVTTDFGSGYHSAYAVAVQPDGKIVAVGQAHGFSSDSDFALARYNNDGTPDAGFGTAGIVTTDFGTMTELAKGIALQSDGKIIVVGTNRPSGFNIALARYNSNGTLDVSFGTGGKVSINFGVGNSSRGEAVSIQPDGKIVVAGWSWGMVDTNFALARYSSEGTLDPEFGANGTVITDLGGSESAYAMALQADGKIVIGGGSDANGDNDFTLLRYAGQETRFMIFLPMLQR